MMKTKTDRKFNWWLVAAPALLLVLLGVGLLLLLAKEVSFSPRATHKMTVTTNRGSFVVELYGKDAPEAVAALVEAQSDFSRGYIIYPDDQFMKIEYVVSGHSSPSEQTVAEFNTLTPERGSVLLLPFLDTESMYVNVRHFYVLKAQASEQDFTNANVGLIVGKVVQGMDLVDSFKLRYSFGAPPSSQDFLVNVQVEPLTSTDDRRGND